jgi:hypothetical protein
MNIELDPYGEEIWSDETIQIEFTDGNSQQSFFPIVQKIFARTIGSDIVTVRPMSSPRVELFFVDFSYEGKTLSKKSMREEDYNRTYSEIDPYGEEDWNY